MKERLYVIIIFEVMGLHRNNSASGFEIAFDEAVTLGGFQYEKITVCRGARSGLFSFRFC